MANVRFALVLAVLLISAVGAAAYLDSEANLMHEFRAFQKKFGKTYATLAERQKAFTNFKSNWAYVSALNTSTTGVTMFFDVSRDEFQNFPCGGKLSRFPSPKTVDVFTPSGSSAPPAFDWTTKGAVTPVKDQGQCGSCWAFSTIGNLEGVNFVAGNKLIGLSEQQLVDCGVQSFGCSGGWPFWALQDNLQNQQGGFESESSYPYTAQNGQCQYDASQKVVTIKSYKNYCNEQTPPCSETQMTDMLVQLGPLSVCLDALPMQYYTGGIDNPPNCDPNAIDHCITMVGYGTSNGVPFWRAKNSWSASWGEQGYYRLIRGKGRCGINKVITTSVM